ncbi:MAG: hypothetical protein ABIJ61_13845, partial [bacterium]
TEGVSISFDEPAIKEISRLAMLANETSENIGARRLQTMMTNLLEEVMYGLPESGKSRIKITKSRVQKALKEIIEDEDLRKYIL